MPDAPHGAPPPPAAPALSAALGPGAEFDLVRRLARRWGARARGLGDDCAALDVPAGHQLVVSTDSSVEGVHFRRDWLPPHDIGWRAAAAAASDLAAAGAAPLGLLLALTVPPAWRDEVELVADGVGALAERVGLPIVGGDLTGGDQLVLAITVLGSAARPLGRRGARPGDVVCVTGRLGGPALALADLLAGREPDPAAMARFARPIPRLTEARWLAARGATAAVDVSDGLAADLAHVAHASGVRIVLEGAQVPLVAGATLQQALGGGEEYEVALTLPGDRDVAALADALQRELGTRLTRVGRVTDGEPAVVLDGEVRVDLPPGYDHFSA